MAKKWNFLFNSVLTLAFHPDICLLPGLSVPSFGPPSMPGDCVNKLGPGPVNLVKLTKEV